MFLARPIPSRGSRRISATLTLYVQEGPAPKWRKLGPFDQPIPADANVADLWPAVREAAVADYGVDSSSIVKYGLLFPEEGELVADYGCMFIPVEEVGRGEDQD